MNKKSLILTGLTTTLLFPVGVYAAIPTSNPGGLLDSTLIAFKSATSLWLGPIQAYATFLFWTLVLISMVWKFGQILLKGGGLQDFFHEFIKFIVIVGLFDWFLLNGPNIAQSIVKTLAMLAGTASSVGPITPSNIVNIGFNVLINAITNISVAHPIDSFAALLTSFAILVILALIAVNLMILEINGYVVAYAGVIFLGLGGIEQTRDMAINYFKTALGIGVKIMVMALLLGIGIGIINSNFSGTTNLTLVQDAIALVLVIFLLLIVDKVPEIVASIVSGSSTGGGSIGLAGMAAAAAAGAAGGAAFGQAAMGALKHGAGAGKAGIAALQAAAGGSSSDSSGSGAMGALGDAISSGGPSLAESMGDPTGGSGGSGSGGSGSGGGGSGGGGSGGGGFVARAGAALAGGTYRSAMTHGSGMLQKTTAAIDNTPGGKIAAEIKNPGAAALAQKQNNTIRQAQQMYESIRREQLAETAQKMIDNGGMPPAEFGDNAISGGGSSSPASDVAQFKTGN